MSFDKYLVLVYQIKMQVIYNHNNFTVKKHETMFGNDFSVSDGTVEFSLNYCPELKEYDLKCLVQDYMNMKLDDILETCIERDTFHMIEN